MDNEWWKRGIIYQVYPRSFQDTDGDGVGDLQGIRRRLPYLKDLGIDAVWLSPIFVSPMADYGYDIADYRDIDPLFGTLADFDRLIADAHARGLKLLLDFVPNHTSDRHPWFAESRASRVNAKRDWYIWRDPKPDGGPPNNWMSNFGGSAWEWDEATGQYYYHAFLKEQPDLNWRNPAVRAAMFDVLRFWMNRGVDGFRIDVLWHLMKDPDFTDNPANPAFHPGRPDIERYLQVHSADHADMMDLLAELRDVVDAYPGRLLIGEIYLPIERLMAYYGRDLRGAHLPFNFQLLDAPWNAAAIAGIVDAYEAALPPGGWPNWVLGNHDRPRVAARVGVAQARIAAMLLIGLRGTPTIYYGDELGLAHVDIPPEAVRDPWEKREPGLGLGRDPSRTPMIWDASQNGGFSSAKPWLPLGGDPARTGVAVQATDPGSMLTLYRRLIALRRTYSVLQTGAYRTVSCCDDVLVFERYDEHSRLRVALNFSGTSRRLALPESAVVLVRSSMIDGGDKRNLEANEGMILSIDD